jgi:hypothetical protein
VYKLSCLSPGQYRNFPGETDAPTDVQGYVEFPVSRTKTLLQEYLRQAAQMPGINPYTYSWAVEVSITFSSMPHCLGSGSEIPGCLFGANIAECGNGPLPGGA